MQSQQLLQVTGQLKEEIMCILEKYDLTKPKQADKALAEINALYDRLGTAAEEVLPRDVVESYIEGAEKAKSSMLIVGAAVLAGIAVLLDKKDVRKALKERKHAQILQEIADNMIIDFNAAIRTARKNTNTAITSALSEVYSQIKDGIIHQVDRKTVTSKVMQIFEQYGMTAFVTSDDKELPLDFYPSTVVESSMHQAEIQGAVMQYQDADQDLVQIHDVVPTCEHCWRYRGLVFSLSGKDKRFPAIGDRLSPYHPHCKCFIVAYTPDSFADVLAKRSTNINLVKDNRPAAVKEAYDKQQAVNRRNNYEKKRYTDIKATLRDKAPSTLQEFRRMKRSNGATNKKLFKDFRAAVYRTLESYAEREREMTIHIVRTEYGGSEMI